jgi:beta-lactamase class A
MKNRWPIFPLFFLLSIPAFADTQQIQSQKIQEKLRVLEKSFDGKIGVYAINTNNNQIIANRADERFPIQSTMKLIGVSALLKKSESNKQLLQQKIHYTKNDLIFWHPVTGKYLKNGMTLEALSEAAITYSDNPAMNLIMKKLGGPNSITDFGHSIGNMTFNVEHYEGNLNSNPNDSHDTSTPKDMAVSLQKLMLGNVLAPSQRSQLVTWMKNNTTSYKRMRAGAPLGWTVADKTGSGDYGIANDIGILWSPLCKPIVLAIYTVQNKSDAKKRDDIVATTTSIILDEFAKKDSCFNELNN